MVGEVTPVLPAGLTIRRDGDEWVIRCKVCGMVWAVPARVGTGDVFARFEVDKHVSRFCAPLSAVLER